MRRRTPLEIASARGHHFLAGPLREGAVVVDLGAHRGEFSVELARRFGAVCFAVEANPALCQTIIEGPRLKRFNRAICGTNGPVQFEIGSNLECSHIAAVAGSVRSIAVQGQTLEDFLQEQGLDRVDLLKVDVEGAEIALFQALPDAALTRVAQVTVEFHDFIPELNLAQPVRGVMDRLARLGFTRVVFSRRHHGDVLFVNRGLVDLRTLDRIYLEGAARYTEGLRRMLGRAWSRVRG